MLPPESSTSTTGCGVTATPLTAPVAGAVAKATLAAAPTVTVMVFDTAGVAESVESVNVSVYGPATSFNARLVKVATPPEEGTVVVPDRVPAADVIVAVTVPVALGSGLALPSM